MSVVRRIDLSEINVVFNRIPLFYMLNIFPDNIKDIMDVYTNSEYDGASLGDMLEFGQNPDMEGGEYYKSLHRQQMATNKLVKQLQKNDEETPLSDTWDSQRVSRAHTSNTTGPPT